MPYAPRTLASRTRPQATHNWKPRGTTKQRGYGADWEKVRDAYAAAHPLCERCESMGLVTVMQEVHHKQPFKGVADPLRLQWSNLMSVCGNCHRAIERERKAG